MPKYHRQFGIPFSRIHKDKELPYIVPFPYKHIVGIVGPKYSGKTIVSSHLVEEYGYRFYSLSSAVRSEAERVGLPCERSVLQALGNELRRCYGRDVLAKRTARALYRDIVEREETIPYIVVDGLKNHGEVEFLRKLPGFVLIAVVAPVEIRYGRAQSCNGFRGSLAEFEATVDAVDSQEADEYGQQVNACMDMRAGDYTLTNDATSGGLLTACDRIIGGLEG